MLTHVQQGNAILFKKMGGADNTRTHGILYTIALALAGSIYHLTLLSPSVSFSLQIANLVAIKNKSFPMLFDL